MDKKKENGDTKIIVSIDRVKNTLKLHKNKNSIIAQLFALLSATATILTTLFTADFKGFGTISSDLVKAFFIVFAIIFGSLTLYKIIELSICQLSNKGTEEWFLNELLEREKPKKIRTPKSMRKTIRWIIQIFVCIFLPIGAFIGFGFLAKWHWAYDVFVGIMLIALLFGSILESWEYITKWFDEAFYLIEK